MGLYSTFSTSQYYDSPPVVTKAAQPTYKQPHQITKIDNNKRKSLYEEAMKIVSSREEYKGPDYRTIYKLNQYVRIQSPQGHVRTNKGRIVEIVASNLMYIAMEDTYKDVQGNWLVDFVTGHDIITRL